MKNKITNLQYIKPRNNPPHVPSQHGASSTGPELFPLNCMIKTIQGENKQILAKETNKNIPISCDMALNKYKENFPTKPKGGKYFHLESEP